jgi:hypothetical protein
MSIHVAIEDETPADPNADCLSCGIEWWDDEDGHPVLDDDNEQTGAWCPGPMRRYTDDEETPASVADADRAYEQAVDERVRDLDERGRE